MTRIGLFTLGAACLCFSASAAARNEAYYLPIQTVLGSPYFAAHVGNSVKLVFGDQPAAGYQPLGEYVADEREHFDDRTDEETCRVAFVNALADLKEHATDAGADAVIGIASYYRRRTNSSATQFECHAGRSGVFVTLRGILAKAR